MGKVGNFFYQVLWFSRLIKANHFVMNLLLSWLVECITTHIITLIGKILNSEFHEKKILDGWSSILPHESKGRQTDSEVNFSKRSTSLRCLNSKSADTSDLNYMFMCPVDC